MFLYSFSTTRDSLLSSLTASRGFTRSALLSGEEFGQIARERQRENGFLFTTGPVVQPPLYRTRRFAGSLALQQTFHGNIFVQVRPMNSGMAQFIIGALLGSTVVQAREPLQGGRDRSAVRKLHAERVGGHSHAHGLGHNFRLYQSRHATAPATGAVSSPFFSFNSVIITSVVRARPLALAAFRSAVRATLVGSMMPSLSMSPYSPVAAL
jgi:hypothetical protein